MFGHSVTLIVLDGQSVQSATRYGRPGDKIGRPVQSARQYNRTGIVGQTIWWAHHIYVRLEKRIGTENIRRHTYLRKILWAIQNKMPFYDSMNIGGDILTKLITFFETPCIMP